MKKIGLYFGSFNPIHIGHLHIANTALKNHDEIWFVLTRCNPLKGGFDVVSYEHREEMIRATLKAFKNDSLKICTIEKDLPTPNYTIDTLDKIKSMFSDCDFHLIMGADNIIELNKWKEYKRLLEENTIYVFERNEDTSNTIQTCMDLFKDLQRYIIFKEDDVKLTVSSTYIRNALKEKQNISYLLPKGVYKYIIKNNLYE